jgi:hypothetical protein
MGLVILLVLATVVAVRYASGGRYRPLVDGAIRWALIAGGIGFALGFFGPMILRPGANQGPLLGIFITGPIGFACGLVYGIVRSLRRREP